MEHKDTENLASDRDRKSTCALKQPSNVGTSKIDSARDEGIDLGSQMGNITSSVGDLDSGRFTSESSCDDRSSKHRWKRTIGSAAPTSGYNTSLDEGIDSRQGNTPLHLYTYLDTLLNVPVDALRPYIEKLHLDELDKIAHQLSSLLAIVDDGRKTINTKCKESIGTPACAENNDNDNSILQPPVTNLIGEQQSLLSCSLLSVFPSDAVTTTHGSHDVNPSHSHVQKSIQYQSQFQARGSCSLHAVIQLT